MSVTSLLIAVVGVAFVTYAVWVLSSAAKHDKEKWIDASPDNLVKEMRSNL